ncbi:hypothetical protein QQX98_007212 [Neonectria punicea]|uniref:Homeobox domain-containing protein n=1 Tax=Neonectria punicea TaxID=979145 RepID=A0ABR1GZ09_9HYPO
MAPLEAFGGVRLPIDSAGQPSGGTISPSQLQNHEAKIPPKVGSRFSSSAVRILRNWLAGHEQHPYTTAEDVELLQNQTGLSKRQVTNWLINARRRTKFQPSLSLSLLARGYSEPTLTGHTPIDIPPRRATPAPFETMNPLQRWEISPPEHEAATVLDISRAVAASSAPSRLRTSGRSSGNASSASSVDTSHSSMNSASHTSAYSHNSRDSLRALDRLKPSASRRRRRPVAKRQESRRLSLFQANTYQYLIHVEQSSPLPFTATTGPTETPTSAYELVKLELDYYMQKFFDIHGRLPSDHELQYEGCSIIFGAEVASNCSASSDPSWLRDVIMSSAEVSKQARLRHMTQVAKSRLSQLKINGKGNIFENCELELQLCRLVAMHDALGLSLSTYELQQEASHVISRIEAVSPNPSSRFMDFLVRLVWGSSDWLVPLRQRGQKLSLENTADENPRQLSKFTADPTTDPEQAIEYGSLAPAYTSNPSPELRDVLQKKTGAGHGYSFKTGAPPLFHNDMTSYRRLANELSRFVASTMSPNNPNSHVPTDDELRYQARWIWCDEDDPWNQTPADNVEWLHEFKGDVGLLKDDSTQNPAQV